MAVEDGSSSNPDRQQDTVKPDLEESVRPVRQSFVDKIRARMQSSEVSVVRLLTGEADESRREDEDDSEEDDSAPEKKRAARRFPRLRGLLIPRPETIRDESSREGVLGPYVSAVYHTEVTSRAESEIQPSIAEAAGDASAEADVPSEDENSLAIQTHGEGIDASSAQLQGESTTQPRSHGDVIDSNNAPAESVHTILQRRRQADIEGSFDTPLSGGHETSLATPLQVDSNRVERAAATTTGALLAVDMLNYAVARGRDAKKEAASIKRDQQIISDQKQQAVQVAGELNRQDLYQKELSKRIEKSEKQQFAPLPKVRNVELSPPVTEAPRYNVDKKTSSTEFIEKDSMPVRIMDRDVQVVERVFAPPSDVIRPDAETILHTVEKAAEKNVPIEAQYELRHERKGNDNFSAQDNQGAGLRTSGGGGGHYASSLGRAATQAEEQHNSAMQGQSVYKQVASTGALGAVVGVILFALLYILMG